MKKVTLSQALVSLLMALIFFGLFMLGKDYIELRGTQQAIIKEVVGMKSGMMANTEFLKAYMMNDNKQVFDAIVKQLAAQKEKADETPKPAVDEMVEKEKGENVKD